jgi:2-polyprenyl-3-methyl-5-hydroxy-6-metoxy-1,4-benzoquinol methylase
MLLTEDLGKEKYDLVLINNVVHHFTSEQNLVLAKKIAAALKPGGVYAIGEFIRQSNPGEGGVTASTTGLFFSLTSSSGTWSIREIEAWQRSAGLKIEKPISPMSLPGWKILIARK